MHCLGYYVKAYKISLLHNTFYTVYIFISDYKLYSNITKYMHNIHGHPPKIMPSKRAPIFPL